MNGTEDNSTGVAAGGCGPLIIVADFPALWEGELDAADFEFDNKTLAKEDVAEELKISTEIAEELSNVCSFDSLHSSVTATSNVHKVDCIKKGDVPEGAEQLQTVRYRAACYKLSRHPVPSKWLHYDNSGSANTMPINRPVTLLTVSVTISSKVPRAGREVKHDRELIVHADQPLTALKDRLVCPLDLVFVQAECSEQPTLASDTRTQDLYKSSFFFIENVFYNDMRDPAARDISAPIREWLGQGKSDYITGKVSTAKMSDVTFNDLTIRLGYPYLYCHQGDCEHNITFTDIRFLHGDDCQDLDQYPILTNQSLFYRVSCVACKLLTAKWMTEEDSLAPADPSFYCDMCFHRLHYDGGGNKLGSFAAYRHIDPSIFR